MHTAFRADVQEAHAECTTAAQQGDSHTNHVPAVSTLRGAVLRGGRKWGAVLSLSHSEDSEIGDVGSWHTALPVK